ncbi:MAG: DEAD/DEAH box helicase [Paenibacillaceae bacterium]|uniref:DNA 3'-5' helicase n=1 Tax=Paenibacillus mellifer TaxID=2937794 RepID=A0A9X1XVI7_9BACL|nr:DNA repair helicase XPB [Paenibacillus mellifer]MBW4840845.1 DEAD/DEAH box helicase [Paenibacillaceae bacterium]MCK8486119.1 DEAD/DEAH box helicase [Paenibacillus mellifer]
MQETGACIVQRDLTVLLEKEHPGFETAREQLSHYAELVKSPALYHTYRITPLTLWHAASCGMDAERVLDELTFMARYGLPSGTAEDIRRWMGRYGQFKLRPIPGEPDRLELEYDAAGEAGILEEITKQIALPAGTWSLLDERHLHLSAACRGFLKQELARLGFPVLDEAGYHQGRTLEFVLRKELDGGRPFRLRPYQQEAVAAFTGKAGDGGSGVVVLPCGAGKTVVGLAAMERFQCETLILTSNVTSVRQWIAELNFKTTLPAKAIGEYSGEKKQVKPVTVSTYQILTHRSRKEEGFKHMSLFNERDWGLIIYDEVHLLPAPIFRATADIQATRRLGLTATLIREDGCERDVFSLIGPKRHDVPWRTLEESGFIAQVDCQEIRVAMPEPQQDKYVQAEGREKFRIAAENPYKNEIVRRLLDRHRDRQVLIIGQYLDQLQSMARDLQVPLITGSTPQAERGELFQAFRDGELPVLVVSKVANFAVDLPDASVAIQISGSFGSRQEEAQRLGRILRPKRDGGRAYFYTLVSENTREQEFALRRQLFLLEQGYEYAVQRDREGAEA